MYYHCLIEKDQVLPFDVQSGVDFFNQFPKLIALAKIMLTCHYDKVQFYYTDNNGAFFVQFHFDKNEQLIWATASNEPTQFDLTTRELQIITLLSAGLSDTAIGEQLFISSRTVGKHIQNIFEKVSVDSRTALATLANAFGLYAYPLPLHHYHNDNLPILHLQSLLHRPQTALPTPHLAKPHLAPLRIGIPFVAKGLGAMDADSQLKGASLAVRHINAQGKLGREIELVFAPFDGGDEISIKQAYQHLLDQEIDAISASYACYHTDIHELMAVKGLPYLHTATNHQAVQHANSHKMSNIFQLCASDVNYQFGIIRLIRAYPALWRHKRLVVISPMGQAVDIGVACLVRELGKLGWQIEQLVSDGWQKTVATLHSMQADMVVLATFFAENILRFYEEFIKNPAPMLIYGIYAPSALQGACEGVIWATTNGRSTLDEVFCQTYHNAYNELPNQSGASLAYDGIQILAKAWQVAPYTKRFDRVNLALKNTVNHGINGAYYLGGRQVGLAYPDDTCDLSISQAHLIFQIQNGQQRLITPSPFGSRAMSVPSWWGVG